MAITEKMLLAIFVFLGLSITAMMLKSRLTRRRYQLLSLNMSETKLKCLRS